MLRFWEKVDHLGIDRPDATWRAQFMTAVGEIAANILRYAYPDQTSVGMFSLCVRLFADRVEARFADRGVPYLGDPEPTIVNEADILAVPEGGFGLMIAQAVLDRLRYRRTSTGINCWRLVKRFDRPG